MFKKQSASWKWCETVPPHGTAAKGRNVLVPQVSLSTWLVSRLYWRAQCPRLLVHHAIFLAWVNEEYVQPKRIQYIDSDDLLRFSRILFSIEWTKWAEMVTYSSIYRKAWLSPSLGFRLFKRIIAETHMLWVWLGFVVIDIRCSEDARGTYQDGMRIHHCRFLQSTSLRESQIFCTMQGSPNLIGVVCRAGFWERPASCADHLETRICRHEVPGDFFDLIDRKFRARKSWQE